MKRVVRCRIQHVISETQGARRSTMQHMHCMIMRHSNVSVHERQSAAVR